MSTYYVPTTPPTRGRAYSLTQPSYPYPATPYSGYNTLAPSYHGTPGMSRSATYYVTPSVSGRSRSHSRPRHSSHHHRSQHHGHHRRSHSARPHHRPSSYVRVFPMGDIELCLLTRNFSEPLISPPNRRDVLCAPLHLPPIPVARVAHPQLLRPWEQQSLRRPIWSFG
ncbi:hypothetical protein BC826DRAFT_330539 [Russula brevipes]|nr:hypothetical protein BC826DRAFT_330539 [Russula brevipes]